MVRGSPAARAWSPGPSDRALERGILDWIPRLGPAGSGTPSAKGPRRRLSLRALLPLVAALAATVLAAGTGFSQRAVAGSLIEDRFYGFFLDRYPLFALAIVYGLARILTEAGLAPGRRGWLRLVGAPLGGLVFLAACLHPTFGGLVARAGFAVGGMAFLNNAPLPAAYATGAAAAALVYGGALGLGVALARARLGLGWSAVGWSALGVMALWWAALALATPRLLGWAAASAWPAAPIPAEDAPVLGAVALVALLPHALLAAARP